MHQDDLTQFATLLVLIGELYSKSISNYLTEVYWEALQTFDLVAIKQAFKVHISNPNGGQFFPKPADLIKIIAKQENSAQTAWLKLEYAVTQAGVYRSVKFDDPLIHATITAMGGWIKICSSSKKDWCWLIHKFQQQYERLANYPEFDPPKYCPGLIEIMNNNNGYKPDPPMLINNSSITLINSPAKKTHQIQHY